MKFANSYRLIKRDAVLDDTWHPLGGGPVPEYVPPAWDGPHVGKRLVEGLCTLALMPLPRGPRATGSHWPAYAHEWADLLAQQEADAQQKQRDQREANRTPLRPSSVEIARTWSNRSAGRRDISTHYRNSCARCRRLPPAGHVTATWSTRHAGCGCPAASCGAGTARGSI